VLKIKFQTSFRHSRILFLEKLRIAKSWGIKLIFISKNPFEVFETPPKSYGQISKRVFENVQKNDPSNSSLKFVHHF